MRNRLLYFVLVFLFLIGDKSYSQVARQDISSVRIPARATVFTLSGLNFNLYNSMPKWFHGYFAKAPYQMQQVKYPASISRHSIEKGVEMLDDALKKTPGPKIVLAHSQGAQVCSRWMREHADDPSSPAAGELIFILTGNPLRSTGGYIIGRKEVGGTVGMPTPTHTPWKIIDFARRYDGWADWVQDEDNKPAVKNASKGKQTLHLDYEDVDLFSSTHTVWTIGNTTFILTNEEELPAFRGRSYTASEKASLRKQIEAAYTNRPM